MLGRSRSVRRAPVDVELERGERRSCWPAWARRAPCPSAPRRRRARAAPADCRAPDRRASRRPSRAACRPAARAACPPDRCRARTPLALPTATTSDMICAVSARVSGSSRTAPSGRRVSEVMALAATRNTYFSQMRLAGCRRSTRAWIPALVQASTNALHARRQLAVQFADGEHGHGAGVADDAGLLDHRRDVGDAAQRALLAVGLGDGVDRDHAVLERDDRGVGPDQRLRVAQRVFGGPQLHRDHAPDRPGPTAAGLLVALRRLHQHVAVGAVDLQAASASPPGARRAR